jgi:hypothetical protein
MVTTIRRNSAAWRLLCLSCVWLVGSVLSTAAENPPVLTVLRAGASPLLLTADDLGRMPRATATIDRDGETATYEGVLLYDILLKAYNVPAGRNLPVNPKLTYILGTARDGYQAMFALGEIAPMFAGAKVMVADKRDGGMLRPFQQPFQMVAPQDKAQGRAMFSLIKLEIVELASPKPSGGAAGATKPQ